MQAIIPQAFRPLSVRIPALFALLLLASPALVPAHDIPNDVTAQLFVKPDGQHLNLLARIPLKAVRDVIFPERAGGYLDIEKTTPLLPNLAILWISDFIDLRESENRLPFRPRVAGTRISLESDKSFASYNDAAAHFAAPGLPNDTNVVWNQAMFDAWFEYPIQSDRSPFSIHPELAGLGQRVVTVVRFLPPGRPVRAFEFLGDPGLVRLDPRWHQAAIRFVDLGFHHILDGTDHLLFLFCLVIPFRRFRALVPVVTSFTVAHSITLIASAYDMGPDALWFPPLIETLIAISIVYMALENIVWASRTSLLNQGRQLSRLGGGSMSRRWIITFGFGLVHGFGFSFALKQTLQFAGSHLLTSLLSFNVGVELGQLLVLIVLVPMLELLFRFVMAERIGTIILSALVAHTGWHWMTERADRLSQFQFSLPMLTAAFLANALRWLMLCTILSSMGWFVHRVARRRQQQRLKAKVSDPESVSRS